MNADDAMGLPQQVGPWLPCPDCKWDLDVQGNRFPDYFRGLPLRCPGCGASIDWWQAVQKAVRSQFHPMQLCGPMGARWTIIPIRLRAESSFELTLADHGIPPDARILNVMHVVQEGDLFPVEVPQSSFYRHMIPPTLRLYPVPLTPADELEEHAEVAVYVTWVPLAADEDAWQLLMDAFEAFSIARFGAAIIPANTAVESKLTRLLAEFLEERRIGSRDHSREFRKGAVTYSRKLNVMLPALLSFTSAPRLPDDIRAALNRLRDHRNDLAHTGALRPGIGKDDVADGLTAALFGVHYLNAVRPLVLEDSADQSAPPAQGG